MRVRNREIRARRHRKEQVIKQAIRDAKAAKTEKPKAEKAAKPAPKKAPAKKKAEAAE